MPQEHLDSDRVNYLIWRYLLESDYRETALHLQKEWNKQDPQQLPFADHVETHALVSTLNKGLLYGLERGDTAKTAQDGTQVPSGLFGPLMPSSLPAPDEENENVKKRTVDNEQPQTQSGPPGKKPRLSNGYENGFEATPMDIDEEQHGDEHAYPSPEQLPSPIVATNGPDQGTQVDKVNDYTSQEEFLDLSDDPLSPKPRVVLQCEFNPRDPKVLAAAGSDALARMWTLSRVKSDAESPADSPGKPQLMDVSNFLDDNAPSSSTISCMSWSSDGQYIALASEPTEESMAKVEFWSIDTSPINSFNGFDPPIICLKWNFANDACLAISQQDEGRGCLLSVMCPSSTDCARFALPTHTLHDQLLDAAWISDDLFVICGGTILQTYHYAKGQNAIVEAKKFETNPADTLSKVVYDWHSQLLATASDSGTIDVWDQSCQRRSFNAHQGLVTSLSWQPLKTPQAFDNGDGRLLASAGDDGAISIWNARSPDAKPVSSMTMNSAVVALAFTPDGAFIAGGTSQHVVVWKVDEANSFPRATWTRRIDEGCETPRSNDSGAYEDHVSMSWDADGQKLAYGANSRLAVINFRS